MKKTLPRILEREDMLKLLHRPNLHAPTGIRNRAILETFYRVGLRLGEVCNLKPAHLRWSSEELLVRHGKGKKDRVVPIDGRAMLWLEKWKAIRPEAEWFFCALNGKRLLDRYIEQMVDREAKAAGIEQKVSPHMLRHTCATELLDEGFTLREVQEFLGHASVATTQIYTHVRPKELKRKVSRRGAAHASSLDGEGRVGRDGEGEFGDKESQALAKAIQALPEESRKALAKALSV